MRLPIQSAITLAARRRFLLHPEVKVAVAQALRRAGLGIVAARTLRHTDLPCYLVCKCTRLEAGPEGLVSAPEAPVRRCLCCLEAGVSGAWCAALPSTGLGSAGYRDIVAVPYVVRSGWRRRSEALSRWNASAESKEGA